LEDLSPTFEQRATPRELALQIALHGVEAVENAYSASAIQRARDYLSSLATSDGRVALGSTLLILQSTIEKAAEEGRDKIVLDGASRYAELAKLADFSAADVAARAAQSEREEAALRYLESTGVIPSGLDLAEAARLTAQYIIDDILSREPEKKEEETEE